MLNPGAWMLYTGGVAIILAVAMALA